MSRNKLLIVFILLLLLTNTVKTIGVHVSSSYDIDVDSPQTHINTTQTQRRLLMVEGKSADSFLFMRYDINYNVTSYPIIIEEGVYVKTVKGIVNTYIYFNGNNYISILYQGESISFRTLIDNNIYVKNMERTWTGIDNIRIMIYSYMLTITVNNMIVYRILLKSNITYIDKIIYSSSNAVFKLYIDYIKIYTDNIVFYTDYTESIIYPNYFEGTDVDWDIVSSTAQVSFATMPLNATISIVIDNNMTYTGNGYIVCYEEVGRHIVSIKVTIPSNVTGDIVITRETVIDVTPPYMPIIILSIYYDRRILLPDEQPSEVYSVSVDYPSTSIAYIDNYAIPPNTPLYIPGGEHTLRIYNTITRYYEETIINPEEASGKAIEYTFRNPVFSVESDKDISIIIIGDSGETYYLKGSRINKTIEPGNYTIKYVYGEDIYTEKITTKYNTIIKRYVKVLRVLNSYKIFVSANKTNIQTVGISIYRQDNNIDVYINGIRIDSSHTNILPNTLIHISASDHKYSLSTVKTLRITRGTDIYVYRVLYGNGLMKLVINNTVDVYKIVINANPLIQKYLRIKINNREMNLGNLSYVFFLRNEEYRIRIYLLDKLIYNNTVIAYNSEKLVINLTHITIVNITGGNRLCYVYVNGEPTSNVVFIDKDASIEVICFKDGFYRDAYQYINKYIGIDVADKLPPSLLSPFYEKHSYEVGSDGEYIGIHIETEAFGPYTALKWATQDILGITTLGILIVAIIISSATLYKLYIADNAIRDALRRIEEAEKHIHKENAS